MQSLALPVLLMVGVGVMMFFSVKKQKRMAAAAKELQASIVPGTRVMTTSGLRATVVSISEDTIELEIAPGVHTEWIRAAVREVVTATPDEADETNEYESSEFEHIDESQFHEIVESIPDTPAMLEKPSKDVG